MTPRQFWAFVAEMPSTNVRIGVTLCLAIATGAKVILTSWEPPWEWLAFLSAWAGIDVVQYVGKRKTQQPPATSDEPA